MNAIELLLVIILGLIVMTALGSVWAKNVFRAGDKTLAAILGFQGYATLSAECGAGSSAGCDFGRAVIDAVCGEGHCAKAARDEYADLAR